MSSLIARTLTALGATAALAAGSAHAASVNWSVGIQAPIAPGVSVGTVISNGYPLPVAPVVVAPPPVYAPAPAIYVPPPVYAPRPVVWGAPVWVGGRWVRYPAYHPHPGVWQPGSERRVLPVPVRYPGREIRR